MYFVVVITPVGAGVVVGAGTVCDCRASSAAPGPIVWTASVEARDASERKHIRNIVEESITTDFKRNLDRHILDEGQTEHWLTLISPRAPG